MLGGEGVREQTSMIIPAVLSVFSFSYYMLVLTRHPLIYGVDGPYYLIQVRSLVQNGTLKYGDPPLSFVVFWLLSTVLGDITLGVKVGTALLTSLASIPAYLLLHRVTRSRIAATAGALVYLLSPHYIRLMSDFIKNAVGCLFLLSFMYFLHRSLADGGARNTIPSLFFLLLTGLTHILDLGLALLFLLLYPTVYAAIRGEFSRAAKVLFIHLGFLGAFAAAALTTFYHYFTDFFKGESFIEELIAGEGEISPMSILSPMNSLVLPLLASGVILTAYLVGRRDEVSPLLLTSVLMGLALIMPFIPAKWLWRFAFMAFIPASIIAASIVSKIGEDRAVALTLSALLVASTFLQAVPVVMRVGPTINMKDYQDLVRMGELMAPESVVVVGDFGVKYWVEYVCDIPTAGHFTPELWGQYDHVYVLLGLKPHVKLPPMPHKVVYEGERFMLVEILPPPPP